MELAELEQRRGVARPQLEGARDGLLGEGEAVALLEHRGDAAAGCDQGRGMERPGRRVLRQGGGGRRAQAHRRLGEVAAFCCGTAPPAALHAGGVGTRGGGAGGAAPGAAPRSASRCCQPGWPRSSSPAHTQQDGIARRAPDLGDARDPRRHVLLHARDAGASRRPSPGGVMAAHLGEEVAHDGARTAPRARRRRRPAYVPGADGLAAPKARTWSRATLEPGIVLQPLALAGLAEVREAPGHDRVAARQHALLGAPHQGGIGGLGIRPEGELEADIAELEALAPASSELRPASGRSRARQAAAGEEILPCRCGALDHRPRAVRRLATRVAPAARNTPLPLVWSQW